MAARQQWKAPVRLVPMIRFHSSWLSSATGCPRPTPALFTSTSSPPKRDTAVWTARPTDEGSRTSQVMASTRAGSPHASASACSARATPLSLVPVTATRSPRARSRRASAWPIPRVPPVMSETRDIGKAYYNACVRIVILGAGEIGRRSPGNWGGRRGAPDRARGPRGQRREGQGTGHRAGGARRGYETAVTGTDDESVVTGATAVVVTDRHGAPPAEWAGDEGLPCSDGCRGCAARRRSSVPASGRAR